MKLGLYDGFRLFEASHAMTTAWLERFATATLPLRARVLMALIRKKRSLRAKAVLFYELNQIVGAEIWKSRERSAAHDAAQAMFEQLHPALSTLVGCYPPDVTPMQEGVANPAPVFSTIEVVIDGFTFKHCGWKK